MLLQVVALLGLGVLGSSAPLQAAGPASSRRDSLQEDSRDLVGVIIAEILRDIRNLNSNAVPRVVAVNAAVERCMRSHLQTFVSSLKTLDKTGKFIAFKLNNIDSKHGNILPKDLDEDCQTAQVTWDDFVNTLKRFLRLLSEKIQED